MWKALFDLHRERFMNEVLTKGWNGNNTKYMFHNNQYRCDVFLLWLLTLDCPWAAVLNYHEVTRQFIFPLILVFTVNYVNVTTAVVQW